MERAFIPYGRQSLNDRDIDAVIGVLKSDYLTQGTQVPSFESELSIKLNGVDVHCVSSGTSALHLACAAMGLGEGDVLWTSPISFVASANCARYCGALVDFVDVDYSTGLMSIEALKCKLEAAEKVGKLPKIIIPVHYAGQSVDMVQIADLSERYGFQVIEDACHALGGMYENEPIGSCKYSDAAVFSFHPVKSITSGEGGAISTNKKDLSEKIRRLRSHGIKRETQWSVEIGPWYYEQIDLGFNYRMTDIQAALGRSQLSRLDEFVSRRNNLHARYMSTLGDLPITCLNSNSNSAHHLFVIHVESNTIEKKALFEYLRDKGIGTQVHYIPIHLQPYYKQLGFEIGQFPESEKFYSTCLSLPLFPSLKEVDQDYIIRTLKEICN